MKCFGSTSTIRSVIEGLLGNRIDAQGNNGADTTTTRSVRTPVDVVSSKAGVAESLPDTLHTLLTSFPMNCMKKSSLVEKAKAEDTKQERDPQEKVVVAAKTL